MLNLSQTIMIGDIKVAAICSDEVEANTSADMAFIAGQKMPIAIVIYQLENLQIFEPSGEEMSVVELAKQYPEASEQLTKWQFEHSQ